MYTFFYILANCMFVFQQMLAMAVFMLHLPRRKYFWITLPVCLLVCCLASNLMSYDFSTFWHIAFVGLEYFAMLVLMFVSAKICWKCSWSEVIYYGAAAYSVEHISYILTEIVFMCFWTYAPEFTWNNYYPIKFINDIVCMIVVYVPVYFLFARPLSRLNGEEVRIDLRHLVLPSVFLVLITMFFNLYRITGLYNDVVTKLYPMALCVMAIFFYRIFFDGSKLLAEKEQVEHMLKMQGEYAKISKENIDLINMKCHDLKHQISALMKIEGEAERNSYVKELQKDIMLYDNIAKTGCEALDVVLTEKSLHCDADGIKFTYIADEHCLDGMTSEDIFSLFGNALDNAIESVETLSDPEKKVISFRASRNGGMLCIRFDNYFDGEILVKDGLPVSNKKDARFHGFGLKSIRYIAQKYKGDVHIDTDNGIFSLTVLLPAAGNADLSGRGGRAHFVAIARHFGTMPLIRAWACGIL